MIRLSDRLQRIADGINTGETMADVGTDHGFLPVYLIKNGICPKVIMTDISPLSLDKAKGTARLHGLWTPDRSALGAAPGKEQEYGDMDFRVGNGLSVLKPFEADAVVIAGMGGKLIRDIMAEDMELSCSFGKFILQPRIGQGHLRKWLVDNGFAIAGEGLVYEGSHMPEIITAISPAAKAAMYEQYTGGIAERLAVSDVTDDMKKLAAEDIRWRIPPWMIYADGPVREFLIRNEAREKEKLENVRRAKERDYGLEKSISEDIKYLKELQQLKEEYSDGKQE